MITISVSKPGKAVVKYFGQELFTFFSLRAAIQWVNEWHCTDQTF